MGKLPPDDPHFASGVVLVLFAILCAAVFAWVASSMGYGPQVHR